MRRYVSSIDVIIRENNLTVIMTDWYFKGYNFTFWCCCFHRLILRLRLRNRFEERFKDILLGKHLSHHYWLTLEIFRTKFGRKIRASGRKMCWVHDILWNFAKIELLVIDSARRKSLLLTADESVLRTLQFCALPQWRKLCAILYNVEITN